MPRLLTIYDIAKEAGVSTASVSRVLSNSAGVGAQKREDIQRLIDKHQFRPSSAARGLSKSRTYTLGLMVADIRNPYYAALAVEVEKAASAIGLTVLLCNALDDRALETANIERLCAQRVEAIIQIGCSVDDRVTDPNYAALITRVTGTIPFVTTGGIEGVKCGVVTIDYAEAMRQVFELLVSLGHKRIALIGGRDDVRFTHEMNSHYLYYLGKYSLPLYHEYVLLGDYAQTGGYRCMKELLAKSIAPTAVIAVNDYTAVGALKAAQDVGCAIPNECSLVSFDNTFLTQITTPTLTSVDYSYESFGEKLLNVALNMREQRGSDPFILIKPKLVIRDSCVAPPDEALDKRGISA